MKNHKVRVGKEYIFDPVMIDVIDGKTGLKKGQIVKVINLPGCPKANTMNHCYVEYKGNFVGMVCCNSLKEISEVVKEINNELLKSLNIYVCTIK
jgi:hypothetical protein